MRTRREGFQNYYNEWNRALDVGSPRGGGQEGDEVRGPQASGLGASADTGASGNLQGISSQMAISE